MNEEQAFKIIEGYFKDRGVASYQLRSFNHLINFGLQNIIDQEASIVISPKPKQRYEVQFGQIYVAPPQVIEENRKIHRSTPADARIRDLTYNSAVHVDITETFTDEKGQKEEIVHPRVAICRIPIMLRSEKCNLSSMTRLEQIQAGECPNDPGGYFVIQGKERVLVGQIRAVYNKVFVIKQKASEKYKYIAEVRSMSEETGHSVLLKAMISADDTKLVFSLPYIKEVIPIGIVFKALGYLNIDDVIHFIGLEENERIREYTSLIKHESAVIETQNEALEYIGRHAIHTIPKEGAKKYAYQVVESELLPHLGVSGCLKEKACFLGQMVNKLLSTSLGLRAEDDRDNYANRRVEVSGILIYNLFRTLFKRYVTEIKTQLEKKKQRPDIISTLSGMKGTTTITKNLHIAFTSGNWGVNKSAYVKTGVSQIVDRMTWASMLSHLHRLNIPIGKEGKNVAIRQIHSSQFGMLCPAESPEGKSAGIALNTALLVDFSRKIQPVVVKKVLEDCEAIISIEAVNIWEISSSIRIFLNGSLIGYTTNPYNVVSFIREMRDFGRLDKEVSVSYNKIDGDILIYCDEGRMLRPLLKMHENEIVYDGAKDEAADEIKDETWSDLIEKNYVQYLDSSEIEQSVIAMYPSDIDKQESDFCEIHPSVMWGIIGSLTPFPDHSQSPRNCYQASMGKQAIGIPLLSYQTRADTLLYVLHYPQKPLVATKISNLIGYNEMPSGVNAVVAIISSAYNQEDSVILNRNAIERGMFILTQYKNIEYSEQKIDSYSIETICLPPMNSKTEDKNHPDYFKRKSANYGLLTVECNCDCQNDNEKSHTNCTRGIVKVGSYVQKGDVIVGKIIKKSSKTGEITLTDDSRVIQDDEEGIVDRVFVNVTPSGYKMVKIVIRNEKIPEVGDKFASRAAQKGTVGMVYAQEDLPFTAEGIVPDIIINPHAIPSRMTVNQLIECVLGKVASLSGEYEDATSFTENSLNIADKACEKLRKLGYTQTGTPVDEFQYGWERMYSPDGHSLEAKIFIGPTYYQRLKHMVSNKMHARARGRITMLTHQPLEGGQPLYKLVNQ